MQQEPRVRTVPHARRNGRGEGGEEVPLVEGAARMRDKCSAARIGALLSWRASSIGAGGGGPMPVDLELVIAVDVSALDGPRRVRAPARAATARRSAIPISCAPCSPAVFGRIAVTYVEWSGQLWQKIIVPWRLIDGAESAEAFSAALAAQPLVLARGTSISAAIDFQRRALRGERLCRTAQDDRRFRRRAEQLRPAGHRGARRGGRGGDRHQRPADPDRAVADRSGRRALLRRMRDRRAGRRSCCR